MGREEILRVDHASGGYGDLRVVWDVSLAAERGSITVMLGPNGVGKTTTLRLIAGLNVLMDGDILLAGRSMSGLSVPERVRAGISYVQEGHQIFRRRSVEENLYVSGHIRRGSRRQLSSVAQQVFDVFPILAERRKVRAGDLSGGQQQMLAIGSALMAEPTVLLLDEPSAGLAPSVYGSVLDAIGLLRERGIAVVLAEQAIDSISVADHVVILDLGRVALEGTPDEVGEGDLLRAAYFGEARSGGNATA
jgi:branched-chain amino acid transport system ATP-binding protein